MKHGSYLLTITLMLSLSSTPGHSRTSDCNYGGWLVTAAISGGIAAIGLIFTSVAAAAKDGARYGWQQQCSGSSGSICCTPPAVTFTSTPTTAPAGSNTTASSATTAPAVPTNCLTQAAQAVDCPAGQLLYCPGGSTTPAPYVLKSWVEPMLTGGIVIVATFGGFSAFVLVITGIIGAVECC